MKKLQDAHIFEGMPYSSYVCVDCCCNYTWGREDPGIRNAAERTMGFRKEPKNMGRNEVRRLHGQIRIYRHHHIQESLQHRAPDKKNGPWKYITINKTEGEPW